MCMYVSLQQAKKPVAIGGAMSFVGGLILAMYEAKQNIRQRAWLRMKQNKILVEEADEMKSEFLSGGECRRLFGGGDWGWAK